MDKEGMNELFVSVRTNKPSVAFIFYCVQTAKYINSASAAAARA